MDLLRKLKDAKNMTLENNYREIQPLNTRKVMVSFDQTIKPPASSTTKAPVTTTADASAIKVTAGLFLLMLIAAIFVH